MNKRIDTSCGEGISPLATFLSDLHGNIGGAEITGKVADYIPELAKADPNWFGISIATTDGYEYGRGDTEVPFTIQSISKAFTYGLALQEWGEEQVTQVVGVEPSGDAFNSISLDPVTGRPFNPMINAGAIAASASFLESSGTPPSIVSWKFILPLLVAHWNWINQSTHLNGIQDTEIVRLAICCATLGSLMTP